MRLPVCAVGVGLLLAACATTQTQAPSGDRVFATHCAACHGASGAGDGPVAASIAVPVPNLRQIRSRNGGEFPADAIAAYIDGRNLPDAHGERQMPVWGLVFAATASMVPNAEPPETRVEALLDYLQSIQEP